MTTPMTTPITTTPGQRPPERTRATPSRRYMAVLCDDSDDEPDTNPGKLTPIASETPRIPPSCTSKIILYDDSDNEPNNNNAKPVLIASDKATATLSRASKIILFNDSDSDSDRSDCEALEHEVLLDGVGRLGIAEQEKGKYGDDTSSSEPRPPASSHGSRGQSLEDLDKEQWTEFFSFMEERKKHSPYPKYLFRAHTHGHAFPRLAKDNPGMEGTYADTFGSDLYLWAEDDARVCFCDCPTSEPSTDFSVYDVINILSLHLNKTQLRLRWLEQGGEDCKTGEFLSSLVSLSGDFRWTAQRTCQIGREVEPKEAAHGEQQPDQVAGLAIFETSGIQAGGIHLWRVADMIAFFDRNRRWFESPSEETLAEAPVTSPWDMLRTGNDFFPQQQRRWARNADEYVCWEVIPNEALISFIPFRALSQRPEGHPSWGSGSFLTSTFVRSAYLSSFKRDSSKTITLEEYGSRVTSFVWRIVENAPRWKRAKIESTLDFDVVARWFLNPPDWGYRILMEDNIGFLPGSTFNLLLKRVKSAIKDAMKDPGMAPRKPTTILIQLDDDDDDDDDDNEDGGGGGGGGCR